ncbi:hypothetical protein ACFVHR_01390 [Streptomyces sp. NPDC127168]|uniref:hypothetical protein n=1 Tax=unclassified Streptomyces TaxID=2593676 RepID=UPI00363E7023
MKRVAQVVHVRPEKVDGTGNCTATTWPRTSPPCQHPVEEAAPGEWWASMTQVFLME